MNDVERWNTALMIALKDLENPNKDTRSEVSEGEVWLEFLAIREELIRYSHTLFRAAD